MSELARQNVPTAPGDGGVDRYRPAFHFTPRKNWMNDPNGLVYFEGEYHLFYQHNPFGSQWGHMSWGHAVSPDLLRWTELPVAIPETDVMIFSGCAVVDHHNVSGLGDGSAPPLLAFFTAFDERTGIQSQHLAYSHDRGRTFTHYRDNPLIDLGLLHFRDPKVFYHAPSAAWVMIVALSREHKVLIYRSLNLLDWTPAGEFGPFGSTSGQWECPDLMLVPIEGEPGAAKWVLKVDIDDGFVAGGSGAQYFVGDFDGHRFTIDPAVATEKGKAVDFGTDFYAAVTWSDLPSDQPGPVWIGWMSNHQTGKAYPTEPWRGAQSLPRRLFLFREDQSLSLGQRPIDGVAQLFAPPASPIIPATSGDAVVSIDPEASAFVIRMALAHCESSTTRLVLKSGNDRLLELEIDSNTDLIRATRLSNRADLPDSFHRVASAPFEARGAINIDLFFDGCLVEIFMNGGERTFSTCVFAQGPLESTLGVESGGDAIALHCETLVDFCSPK